MSGRGGGGGRGRGWYYKEKYARGNSGRHGRGYNEQRGANDDEDEEQARPTGRSGGAHPRGGAADLDAALRRLDGQGYKAYHDVEGAWDFPSYTFILDRAQSDPFAAPSRCRVLLPAATAKLPPDLLALNIRRTALSDFLTRSFAAAVSAAGADVRTESGGWGGEKGGEMGVDAPGQHVLERTSVIIGAQGGVEARFTVALPARGRTILGAWATQILVTNLPRYVRAGLCYGALDDAAVRRHVACVEDTQALRDALPGLGLVAFVGDGSVLPRQSGASDAPMPAGEAPVRFTAPPELAVTVTLPHAGAVRGMGVRRGVTLIVGGGFHGKSTLLKALEAGVYNKVPGDGRELVATIPEAVKIRAEDGRRVEATDISPFISNLPFGKDTTCFRSADASGSTSQAANIQEALELGATCLLLDEDTCATNFMIRDARMQALVAREQEPITPFIAKVRALARRGVSSVLVMGGAGDYFGVSDCVLRMDSYAASDATEQAKAVEARFGGRDASGDAREFGAVPSRVLLEVYPGPSQGERVKVTTRQTNLIQFGDKNLDLAAVEQLVDKSQTRAIADALNLLRTWAACPPHTGQPLATLLSTLEEQLDSQGLDVLAPTMKAGNLARPRHFEIGAALNRLRTVKMRRQQ